MAEPQKLKYSISDYYQSFSGTDTLVYILFPGCTPVFIGAISTISYSMFRNKKPVINIGRMNINGITRGSRIYAGTMIFTLIHQHWFRELQEKAELSYLASWEDLKVDELPLFDIMIISANEYGNSVAMFIWGVDFTDEAQTISVEDLFTENTFSFVARDISEFRAQDLNRYLKVKGNAVNPIVNVENKQRFYYDSSNYIEDISLEREYTLRVLETRRENKKSRPYTRLSRDLYEKHTNPFMGSDVMMIQNALRLREYQVTVNGTYDHETAAAVREYQSKHGYDPDGVVKEKLFNEIIYTDKEEKPGRLATVMNKEGTFVYQERTKYSDIVATLPYAENIYVTDLVTTPTGERFYVCENGYISYDDMFSSYYQQSSVTYPNLSFGDEGYYVMIVNNVLYDKYGDSDLHNQDKYTLLTMARIKQLQREVGIYESGKVDYQTWLVLQEIDNTIVNDIIYDNYGMLCDMTPGTYDINNTTTDYLNTFKTKIMCGVPLQVKVSAITTYANDKHKTFCKYFNTDTVDEYTPSLLTNAFNYNIQYGEPKSVEYIIYPANKSPKKWTFNLV